MKKKLQLCSKSNDSESRTFGPKSNLLESKTRTSSGARLPEARGAKLDFLPIFEPPVPPLTPLLDVLPILMPILKPPVSPQGAHWTFCRAPDGFLIEFVQFKANAVESDVSRDHRPATGYSRTQSHPSRGFDGA